MKVIALFKNSQLIKIIPITSIRSIVFSEKKANELIIHINGGVSLLDEDIQPKGSDKLSFSSRVNYTVVHWEASSNPKSILEFMTDDSAQKVFEMNCSYIS